MLASVAYRSDSQGEIFLDIIETCKQTLQKEQKNKAMVFKTILVLNNQPQQ